MSRLADRRREPDVSRVTERGGRSRKFIGPLEARKRAEGASCLGSWRKMEKPQCTLSLQGRWKAKCALSLEVRWREPNVPWMDLEGRQK